MKGEVEDGESQRWRVERFGVKIAANFYLRWVVKMSFRCPCKSPENDHSISMSTPLTDKEEVCDENDKSRLSK